MTSGPLGRREWQKSRGQKTLRGRKLFRGIRAWNKFLAIIEHRQSLLRGEGIQRRIYGPGGLDGVCSNGGFIL